MKKIIFSLLFVLTICACEEKTETPKENEKPVVKIGVTLPLTGNTAFAGVPVKKSIELALRDIRKNKDLKYDYQLFFEDDKLEPKQIMINMNRLASARKVNAIISMWGFAGPAVSKFANEKKIIHLGCSWGYEIAKGFYSFNNCTLPNEQADTLLNEFKNRNIKTIGIIHNATASDMELVKIIEEKLKGSDIKVIYKNMYAMTGRDFRTDILKMKQQPVDLIFVLLASPTLDIMVKQMKEADFHPKMTSINYFGYTPELFEGQWFVQDADGTENFKTYFQQETKEFITSCVPNHYDSLRMIVEGFEKAPLKVGEILPSNETVVETMLKNQEFKSVLGKIFIDDEGNIHSIPVIRKIINGQVVAVEE